MASAVTADVDLSGFGLERVSQIGRGQYASALLVRETSTGTTHVAKCVSLAALNDHDQDLAHQEVFLLQTLSHPYIVAYRDSFLIEGDGTLVIVMEYCDGGDLRKAIKAQAKAAEYFSEEKIMMWFVQLCLALQYIHSEKVLHRDLKTSNIFLSGDGSSIKLGDFGISRVLEGTTEAAVTIVGTPYYMSPEVCRSEPYNWKSDIWALGCVLYELCMLRHAFESSSLLGLVYKIVSDHYEPIPKCYSAPLNDCIRQLLQKSAEHRPSISEIFANPYVKVFLSRLDVPDAAPAPPEPPAAKKKAPTLRPPGARAAAPVPPPPPPAVAAPPPSPPPLGPRSEVLIIASRIRRRLVGQKLNWISAFAAFDDEGTGMLTPDALRGALTSMHLGLSEAEITTLAVALGTGPDGKIELDAFSAQLQTVAPEVTQLETWARQALASVRNIRQVLAARDPDQRGTLDPEAFKVAIQGLTPIVTVSQLDLLVALSDKSFAGDVDYTEFVNTFAAPLAPPGPPDGPEAPPPPAVNPSPPQPPAPPGMPPLPGVSGGVGVATSPARPRNMPPLPGLPGTPADGVNSKSLGPAAQLLSPEHWRLVPNDASGCYNAKNIEPRFAETLLATPRENVPIVILPIACFMEAFALS